MKKEKMKLKLKKQQEIKRYSPNIDVGLSQEQYKERVKQKLFNKTKQKTGKSYFRIVCENTFTFFNFIWIFIFSALVAVKSYSDLMFIIVIFMNTLISIIQECKAKMVVQKLSLVTSPKVRVLRDGEILEVVAEKLVLDDIIELEIGNSIPADAVVVDGKMEVNESLLTGESDAIIKNVGDVIYAGSFIVSGGCKARVDKIGKDNYIQSIATQAKQFKSPNSNLYKDLNSIIKYIGIGIIPVGVIMFVSNYYSYNSNLTYAVIKTCGALTGMVPAGMFLLVTIALAVGVIKLSKKKTLVKDLFSIEMLARSNVLCLDKTGTITDGTMQVCDVIELKSLKRMDNNHIIANILYNQKASNSTNTALVKQFGTNSELECSYNIDFSSKRKCTLTSFFGIGTFVLGAPEFISHKNSDQIRETIYKHTSNGERVLMLAYSKTMLDESEQAPKNCEPLMLISIRDHIREDAYETIEWFKQNNVQVKIISGDNPITVSKIAQRVGVMGAESFVSLEGVSDQQVEQYAKMFTVFGRVSPEQKLILVKSLKKEGNVVAMTGDGVNDTLALKEADCSIAMADGSDVARGISNLVLLDSKFSSLPSVVKEGRQVINNVQQSSTLFLMKTLFTILLSLFSIVTLSQYPFSPKNLFILELFVIGIPSVILALEPNTKLIRGDFIPVVLKRSIPSGLLMFVNVFTVIILMRFNVLNAEEYTTLATLVLIFTGYVNLFFLCLPISKIRIGCLSISLFCIILAISVMGAFFGMTVFNLKIMLLLIGFILFSIPLHIYIPKVVNKLDEVRKKNKEKAIERRNAKKLVEMQQNQLKTKEDSEKQEQKMEQ